MSKRVNLILTDRTIDGLRELQEFYDAQTMTETIRRIVQEQLRAIRGKEAPCSKPT